MFHHLRLIISVSSSLFHQLPFHHHLYLFDLDLFNSVPVAVRFQSSIEDGICGCSVWFQSSIISVSAAVRFRSRARSRTVSSIVEIKTEHQIVLLSRQHLAWSCRYQQREKNNQMETATNYDSWPRQRQLPPHVVVGLLPQPPSSLLAKLRAYPSRVDNVVES
ncbi:hypothetical protein Rs2_28074 [Raphanus sativus]|nr:hypothetical protein Rs2_28074 [Raphanus sativus]